MEQPEENPAPAGVTKGSSEENFQWDEWTIVEENPKEIKHATVQETKVEEETSPEEMNCSDAEEACQSLEPILDRIVEAQPSESSTVCNEESDGVSVISENNDEESGSAGNENRIIPYEEPSRQSERESEKNITEVPTRQNFLIACSILIVVIAAGLGTYLQQEASSDVDNALLRSKHEEVVDRLKEYKYASELVDELRQRFPDKKIYASNWIEGTKKSEPTQSTPTDQPRSPIGKSKNPLDHYKNVVRTICLVLDDIRLTDETVSSPWMCGPEKVFSDMFHLRTLLGNAIGEMDESGQAANRGILDNIDFRIRSASEALVADFINTLARFSFKAESRMEKLMYKMNEHLCILRNTMPSSSKIRHSLEMNKNFIDNCAKTTEKKFYSKKEEKNKKGKEEKVFEKMKHSYRTQENNPDRRWEEKKRNFENSVEHSEMPIQSESANDQLINTGELKNEKFIDNKKEEKEKKFQQNGSQRMWKQKNSRFRESQEGKNHKRNFPSNENVEYKKKKPKWKNEQGSDSSQEDNADYLIIPSNEYRGKKKVDRMGRDWLDDNLGKENDEANGQWQFDRSRVRDQLRKDESSDNWYFDRMRNRKVSRKNIDDHTNNYR